MSDLEHYLQKLQHGIRKLKATNDGLLAELEIVKATQARQRQSPSTDIDDDTNLEDLHTIRQLRSENRRLARQIESLQRKELEDEVQDLHEQSHANADDTDSVAFMRKLLRRFSDLMLVTTLRADMVEECAFCIRKLAINKSSALPCGHLVCNACLPCISKGADETVKCGDLGCERVFPRDQIELVHYTEQERWDQLLLQAQAWSAFDRRGEMETSEEEVQENFLTDGHGTSDTEGNYKSLVKSSDAETTDHCHERSLSPDVHISFADSPTKLKRKRMEQLAKRSKRKIS